MLDFKEYVELNEAFNSEPYTTEYELYGASSERYYFEEDANRQYKIEINKASKSIPLGKDVRTVWISHKSSGKNYKPIIGKFKDPRRVIATVIDILNSYKTEGKFGSKTKGFAIRLSAANFGPYASLVLKIVKQYMRQQFDAHSTAVKDEETDSAYILIHRKGTDFDTVFSSYVEWHGSDIGTSGQTEVPAPAMSANVPTPVAEPQPEMTPGVSVGDIYHNEDSDVYHVIDTVEDDLLTTKAYYKKNNKRAFEFDMEETDIDYLLDYFEHFTPNKQIAASPAPVVPVAAPVQPAPVAEPAYNTKFKVGDIIADRGPNPWSYSVIEDIRFNTKINQPEYVMKSYLISDGSLHMSKYAVRISWIDEDRVIYKPRDYSKPAPAATLKPGDVVRNPDGTNNKFAIIVKHTQSELEYYAYPNISEEDIRKSTDRQLVRLTNADDIQERVSKLKPFYDADPIFFEALYKVGDRLINITDLVDLTITEVDNVRKEYTAKNQYGMTIKMPFFKTVFLRKALPNEKVNRIWQ